MSPSKTEVTVTDTETSRESPLKEELAEKLDEEIEAAEESEEELMVYDTEAEEQVTVSFGEGEQYAIRSDSGTESVSRDKLAELFAEQRFQVLSDHSEHLQ